MKALVLAAVVSLLAGCASDRVQQYPDVDDDGEGTTAGDETAADRARPATDTGGPHPQDELAGENNEPL